MNPTRKPKPPDKGAPPEHKPSRKVALEEVMRSLQDLVSNELATETTKSPGKVPDTTAKARNTAPENKPPATDALSSSGVLRTAQPVTVEPVAEPESTVLDHVHAEPSASSIPDTVNELPDLGTEPKTTPTEPLPAKANDIPLGGIQQELPYLDAAPPVPAPATVEKDTEALSGQSDLQSVEVARTDFTAVGSNPAAVTEETHWDDFPVLEEVVEQAGDFDTDEIGHRTGSDNENASAELQQSAAKLPPTDAARRLAIQVAARLNVELRKSGQSGLSSDIITRLARLLQEALAKGASNMENDTPDKH